MTMKTSELDNLEQWFKENPKLPQEIDRLLLKRFLKCMYGDVEETKKLIEFNYMLRNKHPQVFINRDPEDENVQKSLAATDMVPLPGLTPERNKLIMFRIVDPDPKKMSSIDESKIFYMTSDCRFTMLDEECSEQDDADVDADIDADGDADASDNMAEGDIQIVDIVNNTMGHLARISFGILRIHMKFLQEAYPVRLKAMHVINCPSFLDKMISFVRPFIADDVFKLIHFHKNGLESLYEHVPRDMLPEEYGGKAGKMADIKSKWQQTLKEKRNYLMDSKQWKIEETEKQSRWWWF